MLLGRVCLLLGEINFAKYVARSCLWVCVFVCLFAPYRSQFNSDFSQFFFVFTNLKKLVRDRFLRLKVKNWGRGHSEVKNTFLAITLFLFEIETSDKCHIVGKFIAHIVRPCPWTLTLTLKSSPQVEFPEKFEYHAILEIMIRNFAQRYYIRHCQFLALSD